MEASYSPRKLKRERLGNKCSTAPLFGRMHAPSLRVLLRHSEGPSVELPELVASTTVRYNRELRTAHIGGVHAALVCPGRHN